MAQSVLGKINYLTEEQYRKAKEEGNIDPNQIYLTPDDSDMVDILKAVYPVGSIYISVNSTSPATLFGGEWEQLKDRFLLGAGDIYNNGTTGGEAEHTLTVEEMPSHKHDINYDQIWNTSGGKVSIGTTNGGPYGGSGYVKSAGGDKPHNNMPPYLAVYMWKRTA
jgi:hypothetical protein